MLKKNYIIDSEYEVLFPIHKTTYGSSYRVKSIKDSKIYMLKIYNCSLLSTSHFNKNGELLEAEIHKYLSHPNIAKYKTHSKTIIEDQEYIYYVVNYISGETLKEKIDREGPLNDYSAINLLNKVSEALDYLHNKEILHLDISPLNIMLDLSDSSEVNPILFDFGLSQEVDSKSYSFNKSLPSTYFCSPELLENGHVDYSSDIFSLGALWYFCITGNFPWYDSITNSNIHSENFISDLLKSRNRKLNFSITSNEVVIKNVIQKSLLPNSENRFKSVQEINATLRLEKNLYGDEIKIQDKINPTLNKKGGEGFKKIAGMDSLKKMIYDEVINPLKDPELSKAYDISPPNAMIFYGPPGCGKTFFAECFAEEIGFNFIKVKPSDIASTYIHGGQEKIKELFNIARDNAPTIIFLDEIDAMIPKRGESNLGHHYESEVNEWLVQINNCSDDNIFVLAATNRIEKIDDAVLRAGRFDRKILIPLPDRDSRKSIIMLLLERRRKVIEDNINYDELADLSSDFSCADLNLLINDCARRAYLNKTKIDQQLLITLLKSTSPSVSSQDLEKYNIKSVKEKGSKIGFQFNTNKDLNV